MESQLLEKLLQMGTVVTLLGYIAHIMWKRFDARVKEMSIELKDLRMRYENEIIADRLELKILVKDTNLAIHEVKEAVNGFKIVVEDISKTNQTVLNRSSTVMECLTQEIKKVKPVP